MDIVDELRQQSAQMVSNYGGMESHESQLLLRAATEIELLRTNQSPSAPPPSGTQFREIKDGLSGRTS